VNFSHTPKFRILEYDTLVHVPTKPYICAMRWGPLPDVWVTPGQGEREMDLVLMTKSWRSKLQHSTPYFVALLHELFVKHPQLHPTPLPKRHGVHPNSSNLVEQQKRCSRNRFFENPRRVGR
jgi:hypothetical protein